MLLHIITEKTIITKTGKKMKWSKVNQIGNKNNSKNYNNNSSNNKGYESRIHVGGV